MKTKLDSTIDDHGFQYYNLTINPTDYIKDLTNLVLNLQPAWSKDELKIKEFNGGLTNKLVGCTLKSSKNENDMILCRIYGAGTENYIDRISEANNMRLLSSINLGPRVYCKFNNGICYEYLPGAIVDSKLLLENEDIYSKIANLVAKMHLINLNGDSNGETNESVLFKKISELLKLVPTEYENNLYGTKEEIERIPKKHVLEAEIAYMENYIKNLCKTNKTKLVFSHNDLLLANIVYNSDKNDIYFIDFEYSGLNWPAYDIANHFNEYAGVDTVDYNLFPNKNYQFKWIGYYLKTYLNKDVVDENLIDDLYKQVNKFTLVSHLFWGIWSIVQARYSHNDFNYASYASIRLNEYFKHKDEFINL